MLLAGQYIVPTSRGIPVGELAGLSKIRPNHRRAGPHVGDLRGLVMLRSPNRRSRRRQSSRQHQPEPAHYLLNVGAPG
jgi:hypothetical protein